MKWKDYCVYRESISSDLSTQKMQARWASYGFSRRRSSSDSSNLQCIQGKKFNRLAKLVRIWCYQNEIMATRPQFITKFQREYVYSFIIFSVEWVLSIDFFGYPNQWVVGFRKIFNHFVPKRRCLNKDGVWNMHVCCTILCQNQQK